MVLSKTTRPRPKKVKGFIVFWTFMLPYCSAEGGEEAGRRGAASGHVQLADSPLAGHTGECRGGRWGTQSGGRVNHDVVVVVVVNHDVVVVHVWQYSDAVGRARGEVRMNVASGDGIRERTDD